MAKTFWQTVKNVCVNYARTNQKPNMNNIRASFLYKINQVLVVKICGEF